MGIEEWVGIPAVMNTKYGVIEGNIKYGVRLPIKSGMMPLQECEIGSKKKIDRSRPAYWFVNENQSLKVRLLIRRVEEDLIKGFGTDSRIFWYNIRKKFKIPTPEQIKEGDRIDEKDISLICDSQNMESCGDYGLEFQCTKSCLYAQEINKIFEKNNLEI